jgi:hypothetical protein
MKKAVPEKLEAGRIRTGEVASDPSWGFYGAFEIQGPCGAALRIIASGADMDDVISEGWEHVSISTRWRPPNWQQMCFTKDLFWEPDECVVQFHPPKSEYVNNHPHCLQISWRDHAATGSATPSRQPITES